MSDDDHYNDILLEDIHHQNKLILEIVASMQDEMKTLARQKNLDEVKQEVKLIRHALTETNRDVRSHEKRIGQLEATVFPRN